MEIKMTEKVALTVLSLLSAGASTLIYLLVK